MAQQRRGGFKRRKKVDYIAAAAAVIRRARALSGIIGRKELVGGLSRLL